MNALNDIPFLVRPENLCTCDSRGGSWVRGSFIVLRLSLEQSSELTHFVIAGAAGCEGGFVNIFLRVVPLAVVGCRTMVGNYFAQA